MRNLFLKLCAVVLVAGSAAATNVHAADLHVITSGGFLSTSSAIGTTTATSKIANVSMVCRQPYVATV